MKSVPTTGRRPKTKFSIASPVAASMIVALMLMPARYRAAEPPVEESCGLSPEMMTDTFSRNVPSW